MSVNHSPTREGQEANPTEEGTRNTTDATLASLRVPDRQPSSRPSSANASQAASRAGSVNDLVGLEAERAGDIPRLGVAEENRARERTALRRRATDETQLLRAIYSQANGKEAELGEEYLDLLAYRVDHAAELLDELRVAEAFDSAAKKTPHREELKEALFVARKRRDRMESRVQQRAGGLTAAVQPAIAPPVREPMVQLPTPELPTFGGEAGESYEGFINTIDSLLEDGRISPVRAFLVLQGQLRGEARRVIMGLRPTSYAFTTAKELLADAFLRPEAEALDHFAALVNLEPLTNNNAGGVRRLHTTMELHFRTLEGQGRLESERGSEFLPGLMISKFPEAIRRRWATTQRNAAPGTETLQALRRFLRTEVRDAEVSTATPGHTSSPAGQRETGGAPRHSATQAFGVEVPGMIRDVPLPQRYEEARRQQLCFTCLTPGHRSNQCDRMCGRCGDRRHHALLHDAPAPDPRGGHRGNTSSAGQRGRGRQGGGRGGANRSGSASGLVPNGPPRDGAPRGGATGNAPSGSAMPGSGAAGSMNAHVVTPVAVGAGLNRARLQTAVVQVEGTSTYIRFLLDTGSEETYLDESIARELGLPEIGSAEFSVTTMGGGNTGVVRRRRVALRLETREGPRELRLWEFPSICGADVKPYSPGMVAAVGGEKEMADTGRLDLPLGGIIGADALPAVFLSHPPKRVEGCLLWRTVFGWVGTGGRTGPERAQARCFRVTASLADQVDRLVAMEDLGVAKEEMGGDSMPEPPPPTWDHEAGVYTIRLPFLSQDRPPPLRQPAEARLRALLQMSAERFTQYDRYMKDMEQSGFIERVPAEEYSAPVPLLPHHGVWGSKLRVVFDGSVALNDYLSTGPNLVRQLVEVLANARLGGHLLSFDLKSAFLTVAVVPADRVYLRFLWMEGEQVVQWQFKRVPFGLNVGPFLLQHVLLHHLNGVAAELQPLAKRIKLGLYVDDVALPCAQTEDAGEVLEQARRVFGAAGFRVHKERDDGGEGAGKLLGLPWSTPQDTLAISVNPPSAPVNSKRRLLAFMAGIFDPLGLLLPWVMGLRNLFQGLWDEPSLGWDDALPEGVKRRLEALLQDIPTAGEIRVRRFAGQPVRVEVYVDASPQAYAAAIYIVDLSGQRRLWLARGRVAPRRPQFNLPRLELMAALLGSRLLARVRHLLPQECPVVAFGDSAVVLSWIRAGPARWRTFVRNRVEAIVEVIPKESWAKIHTSRNPADRGTRGISAGELAADGLWWLGPADVDGDNAEGDPTTEDGAAIEGEERRDTTTAAAVATHSPEEVADFEALVSRFSNLERLLRLASRCHGAVQRARGAPKEGRAEAFRRLLIRDQLLHPPLDPRYRVERGLLMVACRTGEELPHLARSPFGILVVRHYHQRLFHQGASATLAELTRDFHGPTRGWVKAVLRECRPCRRTNARHQTAPGGRLPVIRTEPAAPFARSGVDFFGPLMLVGGRKASVLLITCAVTRAVHLELVPDQSSPETALALRRVAARRGALRTLICDNAKTIKELSRVSTTEFRFIPERSPWWGGFYERMVGTIKRALKTTLRGAALSASEAATILAELEERVNRRPLVAARQEEGVKALTPAHFVYGAEPPRLGPMAEEELSNFDCRLRRRYGHVRRVAARLWKRWQQEYIPQLRAWRRPPASEATLTAGDVVLVDDGGHARRSIWPLGRVEGVITGTDGRVRAARLRIRGHLTRRAVQRLVLLEAAEGPELGEAEAAAPELLEAAAPVPEAVEEGLRQTRTRIIRAPRRYGV
jgi:hypothetical protein